jgi:hypothetical protein
MTDAIILGLGGVAVGMIITTLVTSSQRLFVKEVEFTDEDRIDYLELNMVGLTNLVTDGKARWAIVTPAHGVIGEIGNDIRETIDNAMREGVTNG